MIVSSGIKSRSEPGKEDPSNNATNSSQNKDPVYSFQSPPNIDTTVAPNDKEKQHGITSLNGGSNTSAQHTIDNPGPRNESKSTISEAHVEIRGILINKENVPLSPTKLQYKPQGKKGLSTLNPQNIGGSVNNSRIHSQSNIDENQPVPNMRTDAYGVKIEVGSKKHCISFKDYIEGKPLAEVKVVESYKKYNADISVNPGCNSCSSCCIIF